MIYGSIIFLLLHMLYYKKLFEYSFLLFLNYIMKLYMQIKSEIIILNTIK